MAGLKIWVKSGEVTMVAATAKTVLQVKAPTNQRLLIKSIRATGKQPAGGTDTPGILRMTLSTANFGTGTSATVGKQNPSNGETTQGTYNKNFSAEPTSPTDSGLSWELQPQSGVIEFLPPGFEIEVPGGQAANFEYVNAGTPTILLVLGVEE